MKSMKRLPKPTDREPPRLGVNRMKTPKLAVMLSALLWPVETYIDPLSLTVMNDAPFNAVQPVEPLQRRPPPVIWAATASASTLIVMANTTGSGTPIVMPPFPKHYALADMDDLDD